MLRRRRQWEPNQGRCCGDHAAGCDGSPGAGSVDGAVQASIGEISRSGATEAAIVPDGDHHAGVELVEDRLECVLADHQMFRPFIDETRRRIVDIVDIVGQRGP